MVGAFSPSVTNHSAVGSTPSLIRRIRMSEQNSNDTALEFSRRKLLAGAATVGALAISAIAPARAEITTADFRDMPPYGNGTLPGGVRSRLIPSVNGLTVNILEVGFETPGRPLVLMLHGFPNLAYSWRKVMPALAAAGYYAVAPDCRGFGRTAGWDNSWDADPYPFLALNLLRDQIALVSALGYRNTAMMVGHDQGSLMAGLGALIRPDMFPRLTLIGGGFGGPPSFPFNTANVASTPNPGFSYADLDEEYAKLDPPRKGYQDYWRSREAEEDMKHVPQGMTNFFRAFYYMKSADFPGNQNLQPMHAVRTAKEAAEQNARMPEYYVMRRGKSMPATVAAAMPDAAYIKACKWLTEPECEVYGQEYMRSGWTGALQEYRRRRNNEFAPTVAEQLTFSGRTIEVPAQAIVGRQDWGANRTVGGPMNIGKTGYTQFKGVHMVDGAGHWAHEEQPEQVSELLIRFLREHA
jgi:pimeloyl-ACP methyl ester carboxylesterase